MPLYRMNKQIEMEAEVHNSTVHSNIAQVQMRTTADGHIACKEPLCFWVSKTVMELSPNNKDAVEN